MPPIAILSLNRPDYLYAVLTSLLRQPGIADRQVFLFQDGAVNPFSGERKCEDAHVEANADLFATMIPWGKVCTSPHNLGIALNFDRAEHFMFEEIGAPAAIFLEDDMVLGDAYLRVLDRLLDFASISSSMGYVAAYGQHEASLSEQIWRRHELSLMGQNWAFGLTRSQWLRQRPYVTEYLDIVRSADYWYRDHDAIVDLFHSWGLGAPGTSQDIAKSHASILTDSAKVNTFACFGRYIGAVGVHFDPDIFEAAGYGPTPMLQHDISRFEAPTPALLASMVKTARESAMTEAVKTKAQRATEEASTA
jgi:hypothetical protein